ncbi:hypothetical protein RclHR1_07600007 [Rhizophagus clarus]|uniref:Helitron helicase-like domain-containing protein n=1 Tax=Rhizophagus clarus TaxID=94130 RepID=A0A2Z6RX54_9GLOM|nr:hypothetical protein RclHR1_07600007 [Rhizophagus clarus]
MFGKNLKISNWEQLTHFIECAEFQNRGAPHTHSVIWVENNQIHTCNPGKCGGPASPGQVCKKKFPRPYSPITYHDPEQSRYIYQCVNEKIDG